MNFLKNLQEKKRNQQPKNYDNIDTSNLQMSFDDRLYRTQWYLVRCFYQNSDKRKKNDLFRKIKDN